MTWFEESIAQNAEKWSKIIVDALNAKKEDTTMKVSYNGFTGELVKLERCSIPCYGEITYNISIYDSEKRVTRPFTCVKLRDVKFLGGEVSFG